MRKRVKKRSVGAKSGAKSRLLENSISGLRHIGFVLFRNKEGFEQTQQLLVPENYIVTNYPHEHLYGLSGKKEAFISRNGTQYVFEAKYQNGSGTTDEKLPLIWESFLASHVKNWIVRFDGNNWKSIRGQAAIAWLRQKSLQCPADRAFYVADNEDEWVALVKRLFQ